ncbi:copper-binding protein [Labrys sp. LIt4]|uniref:RND transporter n=1 Tax=Labrys okinawensis TaxID=346911 RepID=A0A2S9Q4N9_9HYPH|nr:MULTISPECIES: copper-binding protein [Labrys]MBP0578539.1 copper-binding protein [Labrys sp. LIt4]PRH84295.1 RND transporter [Labrys okinawensis]
MRKLLLTLAFSVLATSALAQTAPVKGEVTKINEAQGKITLKHGPIKNLDMEGMTMVFAVADPAMLKTVKPGDKVSFEADRVNGRLTVTKIEKAK